MRLVFLILLLFNVLAYGFIRYEEGRARSDNQLMLLQIAPEKMRLVKPGAQPQPAPQPQQPALPPPQSGMSPTRDATVAQSALVCIEWGGFAPADSPRAGSALEKAGLRDRVSQRENTERYWVYIPPLKTPAEVDKKTGELKARGIGDFTVVQNDEQWRYAIALGEFNSDAAANAYLGQLRQKGVRSAVAGQRTGRSVTFVIRDPGDALAARLAALKNDFPNAQLRVTACADALAAKN